MAKRFLLIAMLLLSVSTISYAGDLYLLTINNEIELEKAKQIVDHAYGTIDGKFIIALENEQFDRLINMGLDLTFLAPGFVKDRYYLVRKANPDVPRAPIALSPVYLSATGQIVELEPGSEQILFKSGYQAFSIGARETPLFYTAPGADGMIIFDNYPTDTIADMISQDSLFSYVVRMQEFYTRFIGSDSAQPVVNWLLNKFQDFGPSAVYTTGFSAQSSYCGSYSGSNVLCVLPGSEKPDKHILIGGHKDSYRSQSCYDPNAYAPGADDNASGVATVMELARVFNNFDNKKTIMMVAFGGEELGLCGSEALAQFLYNTGVDLELMINLDMVGFTDDTIPDANLYQEYADPYHEIMKRSLVNVADLIPAWGGGSSDQQSFIDFGFSSMLVHEADFNWGGWHTTRDVHARMDFPYLEKITRALIATVAAVDHTPDPLEFRINDKGDGQSLRVSWDPGCDNCEYTVIMGMLPTFLDDTIPIPPSSYYYDLENLIEDATYYITVYHVVDGFPQLTYSLTPASSQVVPRPPAGLVAEPDTVSVRLVWEANSELDASHYQIFKKAGEGSWEMLADNYTETIYLDNDVTSQTEYLYRLRAVDNDGYISDSSEIVSCYLVSFDGGILVIDETQSGGINPTEGAQSGFIRQIMGDSTYRQYSINSSSDPLGYSLLGLHNPAFWFDDDDTLHLWGNFMDTLQWYFDYGNDFCFAGWGSIYLTTGHTYFYPGNFMYDEMGISYVGMNILGRFVGASGEGDWPDLVVRSDAPNGGHLPNIQVFDPVPGGEVIYRFETDPYHSGFQDRPVGIAYDTYHGKRVILGFPLYWLTVESAQALITRIFEYFAAPSIPPPPPPPGDVNGDLEVNILDVTYLINYLYKYGPAPPDLNNSDPNGDCNINILDITYIISYLYKGGPAPMEGCVI